MAAVSGPAVARHPSPFRRSNKVAPTTSTARAPAPSTIPDPYYGHEETARLCARFVTHLFACPELPPISTVNPPAPSPPLALFIAYALHRTRLHTSVTFAALYLLQRLKARFPAARGSSGHRLFISAFMIASKVICDDTYSNKSWSIVGQGMFALREINQMEREMCSYLEWQLNIEPNALKEFEMKVRRDFKGAGPYPNYTLPSPAPSPMPSTTPYSSTASLSTKAPSFASCPTAQSTSPPKPVPPLVPNPNAYRPISPPPDSPRTPVTPDAVYSTSTSPASSASPPTPPGYVNNDIRVVSSERTMGTPSALETDTVPAVIPPPPLAHKASSVSTVSTASAYSKSISAPALTAAPANKPPTCSEKVFARAVPCIW